MINKKILSILISFILVLSIPNIVYAINGFNENNSTGIPILYHPSMTNVNATVNSSWNEPRDTTDAPHRGVDQYYPVNSEVRSMYPEAKLLKKGWSGSGGNYMIVEYTWGSGKFYSIYYHLDSFNPIINEGDPIPFGQYIAKTGNTGVSTGPHLHWEILNYVNKDSTSTRVSVNPLTVGTYSTTIDENFTVFKNWSVITNGNYRTVKIDAIDYDRGNPVPLDYVKLYTRPSGYTSWLGPFNMIESPTGTFSYTLTVGYPAPSSYDILLIGRRNSTEYWSTYPAKKTCEDVGKLDTGIPINNFTDWDYKVVY